MLTVEAVQAGKRVGVHPTPDGRREEGVRRHVYGGREAAYGRICAQHTLIDQAASAAVVHVVAVAPHPMQCDADED